MDTIQLIILIVVVLLLIGAALAAWFLTRPKKDPLVYQRLLTQASEFYKSQNFRKAKNVYTRIVKQGRRVKNPDPQITLAIGDAYLGIGIIEVTENHSAEAVRAFLQALPYRPLPPEWIEFVALELAKSQDLTDQAVNVYTIYIKNIKTKPETEKNPVILFLKNYFTNLIQSTAQPDAYQRAIFIGTRLLDGDPNLEWIIFALGICEWRLGNRTNALSNFIQAQALNPNRAETPYYMGLLYFASGERSLAESSLRKSLEIKPGQPEVLFHLSRIIISQYTDLSQAEISVLNEVKGFMDEACQANPNQADYWYLLGQIDQALKLEELSEKAFTQAAQMAPNKYEYQYTIAHLLKEKGSLEAAIPFYQRCFAVKPSHFEANFELASIFLGKSNFPEAESLFRRALSIQPDNNNCLIGLGICQFYQNQYSEAISTFEHVKVHTPESLYLFGRAYSLTRQFEKAIDIYKQYGADYGHKTQVIYYLALSQYHLGRYKEASDTFMTIIDAKHEDLSSRDVFFHAAQAFEKTGNYLQSLELGEKALQLAPDDPDVWYGVGKILLSLERWKEALTHFQEAARLKPDFIAPYLGMGYLNEKVGNFEDAKVAYQEALRIDPQKHEAKHRLGITLAKLELWREALSILNEFTTRNDQETLFYLAVSQTTLQDFDHSLLTWQKLVTQFPQVTIYRQGYVYTQFELGLKAFNVGNYIEAINHWEACQVVSPGLFEVIECLTESYFRQGVLRFIQGLSTSNLDEAVEFFKKAQANEKDDLRSKFYLGIYSFIMGDLEGAIQTFEELAGHHILGGCEQLLLAEAYLQSGKIEKAKLQLEQIASRAEALMPAYALLSGNIASMEKRWENAFLEYKKVLVNEVA